MKAQKFINVEELEPRTKVDYRLGFRLLIEGEYTEDEIDNILGAVGYAQKATLKSHESVNPVSVTVLGDHTLIESDFNFETARCSDFDHYFSQFFNLAEQYISEGVYHKGAKKTLGGFVKGNISFFVPVAVPKFETWNVRVRTKAGIDTLLDVLKTLPDTEILNFWET